MFALKPSENMPRLSQKQKNENSLLFIGRKHLCEGR